jgi:hypothetical protein
MNLQIQQSSEWTDNLGQLTPGLRTKDELIHWSDWWNIPIRLVNDDGVIVWEYHPSKK